MNKFGFMLLSTALTAGFTWAQLPPTFSQPLSQVKQFLQLSDSQFQSVLTNNEVFNRWSADKQNRIRHVQTEIADETAKSPLDPNALGVRYAEIETICRQIREQAATSQQQNLAVLSDAQKTKLNILADALKLAPIISEAQSGNLLGGFGAAPYGFTSSSTSFSSFLLGGVIAPANGCYLPFPVPAFRTGDFSDTANPPIPSGATSRWFDRTDFVRVPALPKKL